MNRRPPFDSTPGDPQNDWRRANVVYVRGELRRLRLLLRREVRWMRQRGPESTLLRARAAPIGDEEVERMLEPEGLLAGLAIEAKAAFYRQDAAARKLGDELAALEGELAVLRQRQQEQNLPLPLDVLCRLFHLSDFDRDTLLLCLGAELDPALRRAYGYVQDDVGRQRATPQLALRLFVPREDRLHAAWHTFQPSAPLRYFALLDVASDEAGLSRGMALPERVVSYLQGFNRIDPAASAWLQRVVVEPASAGWNVPELAAWARREIASGSAPRLNLVGAPGSGRRALARALCEGLGLELHSLKLAALAAAPGDRVSLTNREAVLSQMALFLDASEVDASRDVAQIALIDQLVERVPMLLFVASRKAWPCQLPLPRIGVEMPDADAQLGLWRRALGEGADLEAELPSLVEQFSFGPSQIDTIVQHARLRASIARSGAAGLRSDDLWLSCSEHGSASLDGLAQRIEPRHGWDDIVLPKPVRDQLEEVAAQVSQRAFVYRSWGFGAKLNRGRGISALFAGPSGTGKTMAAEVLAAYLKLPMYRIDLSGVINKYVGETEKNLGRVFDAAEQSGAILFFDEADALFGKRSEVKDSHDRYANIEINYLLQRMEEYRGLAILATNMKAHLDQAFLRRLRFVIDFPFPDLQERLCIWERAFPAQARLEGLDLRALARMDLTGSSIKSIALNAAFLAARAETPITMRHVFNAAKREYAKMEKLMSELERHYGQYGNPTESEVN